jgi:hypothetical protein
LWTTRAAESPARWARQARPNPAGAPTRKFLLLRPPHQPTPMLRRLRQKLRLIDRDEAGRSARNGRGNSISLGGIMFNSATTVFFVGVDPELSIARRYTRWPIRDWRRRRDEPNGGSATSLPLGLTGEAPTRDTSHRPSDNSNGTAPVSAADPIIGCRQ